MKETLEYFYNMLTNIEGKRDDALNRNAVMEFNFLAGKVDMLKDVLYKLEIETLKV